MNTFAKKRVVHFILAVSFPFLYAPILHAAQAIDLEKQSLFVSQSFSKNSMAMKSLSFVEHSRSLDFNKTTHIRFSEKYRGYPIFGSDAVIHVAEGNSVNVAQTNLLALAISPKSQMNGVVYQSIEEDLGAPPAWLTTQTQTDKAVQAAIQLFKAQVDFNFAISDSKTRLMVFVDEKQKAHWVYEVSFAATPDKTSITPANPVYILDAATLSDYQHWDNIKTHYNPEGGGFGGNKKMGKLIYDGAKDHLQKLLVTRDPKANQCALQNNDVTVRSFSNNKVMSFPCEKRDTNHNNIYWDGSFDAVNGGYSPGNDALFAGDVVKSMYRDWFSVDVLKNSDGTPMMLTMVVHRPNYDNAYWDGRKMNFGDGEDVFYPLTSLGVGAHEVSHGFTEQHSNLTYAGQSGGMNESFSDMAAQAAEVFAYGVGKNSWQIGPEIFKAENQALRYMDRPSKDCVGRSKSRCSIDDASQYRFGLDVHYSSGVYNRLFYLISTAKGWSVRKTFGVMLQANANYWTRSTNFAQGACGILSAAKDHKYNLDAIKAALTEVKINFSTCKNIKK